MDVRGWLRFISGIALASAAAACSPVTEGSGNSAGETETDGTSDGTDSATTTTTTTTAPTDSASSGSSSAGTGSGSGGDDAAWPDWPKRRPVIIDNTSDSAYQDAQVAVTVEYDSDMLPDFADLRFSDESGTMAQTYWLETHVESTTALVWVRVPELAANAVTTIYMLYGNAGATSSSSGAFTFSLFDDFEGTGLDADLWTATGSATVQNGQLVVATGAVVLTDPLVLQPGTLVEALTGYVSDANNATTPGLAIRSVGGVAGAGDVSLDLGLSPPTASIVDDGQAVLAPTPYGCCDPADSLGWFGVGMTDSDSHFTHNIASQVTHPASWSDPLHVVLGHTGGLDAAQTDAQDMVVNTVLARRLMVPAPTVVVGNEEDL